MKKIILLITLLFSVNAFATKIINNNTYAIDYQIKHGETCSLLFTKGTLSPGQELIWTGNESVKPDDICLYARGKTSITGTFCRDIENAGSVIEVRDAGLFRGVTCECLEGCNKL